MHPLEPRYQKRFVYSLTTGENAISADKYRTRTFSMYDIQGDSMVYGFMVSDGVKVTTCNLPVPSKDMNKEIDLFDFADRAASEIKARIKDGEP